MSAILEVAPEVIASKELHAGPCCADGIPCHTWLREFRSEYRDFHVGRIKEARKIEALSIDESWMETA
jgi:hypothetical protein